MADTNSPTTSPKVIDSAELKAVLKRVKGSGLAAADKEVLVEILNSSIKLKALVEKSSKAVGGRKVIATLPFGFDIVK